MRAAVVGIFKLGLGAGRIAVTRERHTPGVIIAG
jgi:hypothetical protein